MTALFIALIATIVVAIVVGVPATAEASQQLYHRDEQFSRLAAWIADNEGFIDDRLTVRTIPINNGTASYRGIFTNADIRKDEYLCYIPWSTIIGAGRWQDEEQGNFDGRFEDTAFHLLHELKQGDASRFAPYTDYIRSQRITVPSAWSMAGREFLTEMVGEHLPPRHLERNVEWFIQRFGMNAKTMKAAFTVSTRAMQADVGSQWLLIPFVDLQNHHSDLNKVNTERFARSGKGFEIRASKDIAAGSELYTHYWGTWTHYFFEEFGFVESFPQRWRFEFPQPLDGNDESIDGSGSQRIADVQLKPSNSSNMTTQKFDLEWFSDFPDVDIVDNLQTELTRLETFKRDFDDPDNHLGRGVPQEELKSAWEYYGGLTTALREVVAFFYAKEDEAQGHSQCQGYDESCETTHASAAASIQAHS